MALLGLLVAVALLVVGGLLLVDAGKSGPEAGAQTLVVNADAPPPGESLVAYVALPPETLSLDSAGVQAPIVDATVPNGVLTPPDDVSKVGIWVDGAALDATSGTTLLAGHVNLQGQGNGALYELARMRPGDTVHTSDASGDVTAWRVTSVVSRPKSAGVEESVLDGPDGPRRLAVVTCGGDLSFADGRGNYEDNVYLYAEPLG